MKRIVPDLEVKVRPGQLADAIEDLNMSLDVINALMEKDAPGTQEARENILNAEDELVMQLYDLCGTDVITNP